MRQVGFRGGGFQLAIVCRSPFGEAALPEAFEQAAAAAGLRHGAPLTGHLPDPFCAPGGKLPEAAARGGAERGERAEIGARKRRGLAHLHLGLDGGSFKTGAGAVEFRQGGGLLAQFGFFDFKLRLAVFEDALEAEPEGGHGWRAAGLLAGAATPVCGRSRRPASSARRASVSGLGELEA